MRALRTMIYRAGSWGDRQHWELTIGRVSLSRWCGDRTCSSAADHPITVQLWNRAGSAASR